MISDSTSPLEKVLKLSFLTILAGFFIALLISFAGRIFYPFELGWIEGDILCSAIRFAEGKAIYANPTGDFVAYNYPPLFYWLVGLLIPLFGPHFWIGRLISILSFFTICFLIYKIVHRQTGNRMVAVISFLMLSASYNLVGSFFDVMRLDSFLLATCFGALFLLDRDIKNPFISGVLFVIAFFTKQTAVFFIAPASVILWQKDRRAAIYFSLIILCICSVLMYLINVATDSWYWFYIFRISPRHIIHWHKGCIEAPVYLLRHLPVVCAIVFLGLLRAAKNRRIKDIAFPWVIVLPFAFIATALPYGKEGGFINNFYPMIIILCILFGIFLKQLLEYANSGHHSLGAVVWGLLLVQALLLIYNPFSYIPQESDVIAGKKFIREVSGIDGEVYIPEHSFYGVLAGKKMYPRQFAVDEVERAFPNIDMVVNLKSKISRKEFKAIYTDFFIARGRSYAGKDIYKRISKNYRLEKRLTYSPENAFTHFYGPIFRPDFKYVPKSNNTQQQK